ncbi:hypothetical protein OA57_12205 [Chelonobacter oris]|uniref:Uncharacterized protein n=1 Tax=Chelonobacter oris TaxID=505317 RepID=A0A0A3AQF6_9PAST|nr:hypothetical protein [Chelonobacter oris]KGQ69330.1 hypothetical protein OA57_12205 [Chelonobacter oris]
MKNKIARVKEWLFFPLIIFWVMFFIYSTFHIKNIQDKNIRNQEETISILSEEFGSIIDIESKYNNNYIWANLYFRDMNDHRDKLLDLGFIEVDKWFCKNRVKVRFFVVGNKEGLKYYYPSERCIISK